MKISYIYIILIAFALNACSSLAHQNTTAEKQHKTSKHVIPHQLSNSSLYLAAQTAVHQGQLTLANQLLSSLVMRLNASKETQDHYILLPRLQLAELLLANNQASEALKHLQPLIEHFPLRKRNSDDEQSLHLLYARSLIKNNQYDEAFDETTRLIQHYPQWTNARLLQIKLFIETKKINLAHLAIKDAIATKDTPQLRQLQADTFLMENKNKQALQSIKQMQKLIPDSESPALFRSSIEMQMDQPHQAEKTLRHFLKLHPRAMRIRNALARLLIQTKRAKEAIDIYKQLEKDIPNQAEIISALGLLYFQQQQYQRASAQFEHATKLAPKQTSHVFYWAASLEALKKSKQAIDLYQRIPSHSPLWLDAQLRLARIHMTEKHYAIAKERLQQTLKHSPRNMRAWELLSTIYLIQKDYQGQLEQTQETTALKNVSANVLLDRAISFEHFKRYDDATSTLLRLIQAYPEDHSALNFLGYLYAEQGIKLDEAEAYIQRALTKKPNDGYYLDSLAWVYYQRKNYSKAITIQKKALQSTNDDPVMHEHLGDMLWKNGSTQEAIKQWKQSLQLKTDHASEIRQKIKHGLK